MGIIDVERVQSLTMMIGGGLLGMGELSKTPQEQSDTAQGQPANVRGAKQNSDVPESQT